MPTIPGALPLINDPAFGAYTPTEVLLREAGELLAPLGRAEETVTPTVNQTPEIQLRKTAAAVVEAIQYAHVRIGNLIPDADAGLVTVVDVTGVSGTLSDWEPYDDTFTEPRYSLRFTSGTAFALGGLVHQGIAGVTVELTVAGTVGATVFQLLIDDAASAEINRISTSRQFDVSPAPTFSATAGYPANAIPVFPGQTVRLVSLESGWQVLSISGSALVSARPAPQELAVSSFGLATVVSSFGRVVSTATTPAGELRALSTAAYTETGIFQPWMEVTLWNDTGGAMSIIHENGATSALLRILTSTGAPVAWPAGTEARFVRDGVNLRWRLVNTPA